MTITHGLDFESIFCKKNTNMFKHPISVLRDNAAQMGLQNAKYIRKQSDVYKL